MLSWTTLIKSTSEKSSLLVWMQAISFSISTTLLSNFSKRNSSFFACTLCEFSSIISFSSLTYFAFSSICFSNCFFWNFEFLIVLLKESLATFSKRSVVSIKSEVDCLFKSLAFLIFLNEVLEDLLTKLLAFSNFFADFSKFLLIAFTLSKTSFALFSARFCPVLVEPK